MKNYAKAVKWYALAAEQGNSESQYNLVCCYEKGNGVEKDYAKALELYKLAAEQGNTYAKNKLLKQQ